MHILFLSRWYPYPADNGSKLRILALIKGLATVHQVTLISYFAPESGNPDITGLQEYCARVIVVPRKDFEPDSLRARLGFFSLTPRSVLDTYSSEVESYIRAELSAQTYDVIIASQFDMAIYRSVFQGVPSIFEEAEVGVYYDRYVHAENMRQKIRNGLTWWKHSRYLAQLINQYTACTVVSDQEQQHLKNIVPEYQQVAVLPNCVDLASYHIDPSEPETGSLIYTGSFRYPPNYEAMLWFTEHVFPKILSREPNTRLIITGDDAGLPLSDNPNIQHVGHVKDIRPLVSNAWISLAPIHSGGGTRLKILEAMALGTPVVSTTKGAEGLDVISGKHVLIADTAEDFANACLELLSNQNLRTELAQNAYQLTRQKYDWQAVMPQFLNLVETTARN
jgi:polysaccharide biosynthesis protein PslH